MATDRQTCVLAYTDRRAFALCPTHVPVLIIFLPTEEVLEILVPVQDADLVDRLT